MDASDRGLAPPHHGIPSPLTSFVGRREEIRDVIELLGAGRLVTLVGSPGVGKTRLAFAVGDALRGSVADGIWPAELAPLAEASLVPQTVATALGLTPLPSVSVQDALVSALRERELLLILDNCEHVIDACVRLASAVLGGCPGVRILATSREGLRIGGETIFRVEGLGVPAVRHGVFGGSNEPDATNDQSDAVCLFVDRARALLPRFALTRETTAAVERICRRLDGVPLAIELAAARVTGLAPEQIADRLDVSFGLLSAGSRTAPDRHQTIRAAVDWSYSLLSEAERELLRHLSVFAGGWTLEAAEAIGAHLPGVAAPGVRGDNRDPAPDTLDLLLSLVDKSLVQVEREAGLAQRYRLLEGIRQYAAEQLDAHREGETARRRHRDWFLAYARRADTELRGSDADAQTVQLRADLDNVRVALAWSLAEADGAGIDAGFQFATALEGFWFEHDYLAEGRLWLERILAADATSVDATGMASHPPVDGGATPREQYGRASMLHGWHPRVAALNHVSNLAYHQQDRETQLVRLQESRELARQVGDTLGLGHAHAALGNLARAEGDYERSSALLEESLRLFRQANDDYGIWRALTNLGETRSMLGDFAGAAALIEESQQVAHAMDDPWRAAQGLRLLGIVAYRQGDLDRATALLGEAVSRWRAMHVTRGPQWALYELGSALLARGDIAEAGACFRESLGLCQAAGDRRGVARGLEGVAGTLAGTPSAEVTAATRAARLLGAAAAIRTAIKTPVSPADRVTHERGATTARAILGEPAFEAAHLAGAALSVEQAIALALDTDSIEPASTQPEPTTQPSKPATQMHDAAPLTPRERQVAGLVATGLTNRQIAERLVLSERTIDGHVARILARLDLSRRAQLAVWATQHGLGS